MITHTKDCRSASCRRRVLLCLGIAFHSSDLFVVFHLVTPVVTVYNMADLQATLRTGTLVTVDDFDPLVSYSNYADWTTPDPSQNPTWFNATEDVTGSPWHQGEPSILLFARI